MLDQNQKKEESKQIKNLIKKYKIVGKSRKEVWRLWNEFSYEEARDFALSYHEDHKMVTPQDPLDFAVYGRDLIDDQTLEQMTTATTLPVAVAGSLMPDAHLGYGLPIGGVLATNNAVIPYAVGVDIACRMKLSVFDNYFDTQKGAEEFLETNLERLSTVLLDNTYFGMGYPDRDEFPDHDVLYDESWNMTKEVRELREKAVHQLGTSGGGNHFVEWVIVDWFSFAEEDVPPRYYIGLMSHSGSRGFGFSVANHYSKLAQSIHYNLPDELKHLAWLDMDTEEGQEYWEAMQLAGRYASANHDIIHEYVAKASDLSVHFSVENHHNFAWKESYVIDGVDKEVIVHRKGATRAHEGLYGIIPSSMASAGMVAIGMGNAHSLNSASHGAGRTMSRRQAKLKITKKDRNVILKKNGVTLLGGGLDEAPQAYKNISDVYSAQANLIKPMAWIQPKIVRMADD